MKTAILLLVVSAVVLSSCSSAYKTGQTPDDVYYSPARQLVENENVKKEEKKDTYTDEYYADRYLYMKVRNRYRWNDLNDWYNYDRYSYGYNYYYGSTNNPYNSWNYYYNPYCCCHTNNIYSYPKYATVKPIVKPHNFNLGGYTNTIYNNNNTNSNTSGNRVYTNTNYNNTNGAGKTTRTIFERNNNNNSSSSSSSTPSRTYTPSSSSSSSNSSSSPSSGSSGSSGSVTRPGRN